MTMTMTKTRDYVNGRRNVNWFSWLDRPLLGRWCAVGWLVATGIFTVVVRFFGGPAQVDAAESVYSTWAIAHGHLARAYPPGITHHFAGIGHPIPFIAPLWPLLSGVVAAVAQIGHSIPFPSGSALGPHCSTVVSPHHPLVERVRRSRAHDADRVSLLAGVDGGGGRVLRASGRGRCAGNR